MNEEEKLKVSKMEGREKKGKTKEIKEVEESREKYKFFVDLRDEREELEIISKLLREVNKKDFGREILFKDLAVYAVTKLTPKDLEKIQESSLNDMERVQRLLKEHNEKNKTNLDLGTFLVKKLNI